MKLLMSLVEEQARTLVVVTHDSELAKTGDRKIELADGRVVGQ